MSGGWQRGRSGSVRYLCRSILALPFRASVSLRWWSGLRLCCTGKGGQYADDGAEVEGGGDAEEGEERGRQNQQRPPPPPPPSSSCSSSYVFSAFCLLAFLLWCGGDGEACQETRNITT